MAEDADHQFWYNMRTGAVEKGMLSPSVDRVGPFPTFDEATHALDKLRANSAKWAEEDETEDR
ncbi:SPOR domain-containing protein [Cryobacterium lactosi]|uniref:SPOR domain-containing protein n=1 Tax=Cryobacterium lactosi TaxID=1259202 RepID=A0A4R9BVI4_9MICO|nr:SPOR domain-containing protein [Cryobacterium lactosi]TFD91758.1 SPOR domain-containing protein [Cryobacterium lactosi]